MPNKLLCNIFDTLFQTGDTIVALHPGYPYSYAPGDLSHFL